MFTVYLKNWHNNWADPVTEYPFDALEDAIQFAEENHTLIVDELGDNLYINNGTQAWVESFTGDVVYNCE
jgi:hypothetical protein